jgi:hypothetical protein
MDLGAKCALKDTLGCGKALRHIPTRHGQMSATDQIAPWVYGWRSSPQGIFGVKDRWQHLVLHLHEAQRILCQGFAFCGDHGHLIAYKAHNGV